jgi:hypothetical protein
LKDAIAQRRDRLASMGFKLQPFLALVKKDNQISDVVVIVDSTVYPMSTVLTGMDVLFKIFYVFSVEYPKESEHIWGLIQTHFYHLPLEKKNAEITKFLKKIK